MNRKIIITISSLLVVFLLALFIIPKFISNNNGKTEVIFHLVPKDATITIDNQQYKKHTVFLEPGDYTATISRFGFQDSTIDFSVKEGDDKIELPIGLVATTDETEAWADKNLDQYLKLEGISSSISDRKNELSLKKYPISEILPILENDYRIGFSDTDNKGTVVFYLSNFSQRSAAIDIRDRQQSLYDYHLEFYSLDGNQIINPFTGGASD